MLEVNQVVELSAFDLSYEGLGVCKYNQMIVFVENLLIGEVAKVAITKKRKKFFYGRVVEYLQTSEERLTPRCKYYNDCGGCRLSHMSNDLKRQVKISNVTNLARKLDLEIIDCMTDLEQLGYRNKVVMHLDKRAGQIIAGPYASDSNTVVGNECLLMSKSASLVHSKVIELLNRYCVSTYDSETSKGNLKHLVYHTNSQNQVMVTFVALKNSKDLLEVVSGIQDLDSVCCIFVNIVDKHSKHLMGKTTHHLYGEMNLVNQIGMLKYQVSPDSFFQVNNSVCETMFKTIVNDCSFNGSEVVLDAYSGTGAIGLYLANAVKCVVGIDISKSAIEDANSNLSLNNIYNASYYHGDIFKKLSELEQSFDTVIVDPPRSGCSKEFLRYLVDNAYGKLVYMSCNPATLTRDLEYLLANGYHADAIKVFDMFPHSSHVECLVVLNR